MNQNYSPEELLKYLRKSDLIEHKTTKTDLILKLTAAYEDIKEARFEFTIITTGTVYFSNELVDKLILRKLNDNLKRIYKDEQANRRVIVKQVKTLLEEPCPKWILRTDISQFYESINRSRILNKLKNDAMLSYFSILLLEKIFNNAVVKLTTGLPRGINISSTLSEIYMRRFDKWIRGCQGIYYSARFVDDIIIFSNREKTLDLIRSEMNERLEIGLKQNRAKTELFNGLLITPKKPLEYLGYNFTVKKVKSEFRANVSIARKKIKKMQTRIVLSFLDYFKNADFSLLESRIMFLCGNYSIKNSGDGHDLRAGIYYNYSHITDNSSLISLNIFFQRILNATTSNSFGVRLNRSLIAAQKDILKKYSFKHGFDHKVYNKFTAVQMKEIKKCWL